MLSPSVVELDGPWSHELLHTRGLRLHVAVSGPTEGPLILCIHGAAGGWFDYKDTLQPFAQAGFRTAAIDLRGYGLSDKPPIEPGQDIRTLIGDISGVIQALGCESAILIGNDTGAALAWSVATERPERVAAVVSISGAHPIDLRRAIATHPWDFGWFIIRSLVSRLPRPFITRLPLEFIARQDVRLNALTPQPELVELREKAILISNTLRGSVWNHRLLSAPMPFSGRGKKVTAPVLFIHANQRLWGPVIERALRRSVQLDSVHLPGTKNLPHAEAAQLFVNHVVQWLKLNNITPICGD